MGEFSPSMRYGLAHRNDGSRPTTPFAGLASYARIAYTLLVEPIDPADVLDSLSLDLMVKGSPEPYLFEQAIAKLAHVDPKAATSLRPELQRLLGMCRAPSCDFAELLAEVGQITSLFVQKAAEDSLSGDLHWDREASPAIVDCFLSEARERLIELERILLIAERGEATTELIDAAFRAMHNLKGESAAIELHAARALAHRAEDLLGAARSTGVIASGSVNILLQTVDTLRTIVAVVTSTIDQDPSKPAAMPGSVQRCLEALRNPITASDAPTTTAAPGNGNAPAPTRAEHSTTWMPEVVDTHQASTDEERHLLRWMQVQASLIAIKSARHEELNLHLAEQPAAADDGIRVPIPKLDALIALTGDIHGLMHQLQDSDRVTAARARDRLGGLVERLQHSALTLRLVPVADAFQRLQRVARDTARQLGRPVDVSVDHGGVEIDKSVIERLSGPLMHLVRNAIDHGIEDAAGRQSRGKSATGHIRLTAHQRGNRIEIIVADDGKGLDTERIKAKAISQGLIEADAKLSPDDIFPLIFLPGFSTATQVTDISGRGVGLDVVREAVEELGGDVTISSLPDQGTRFVLNVPLTLMLQEGLITACGGRRVVALQQHVHEVLPLRLATVRKVMEHGELLDWRGTPIPLVRLREFLAPKAPRTGGGSALVITGQGDPFALVVDEVLGGQRVVVRALPRPIERSPGLMGAALLTDGGLALVIDPITIARYVMARRVTRMAHAEGTP